jgi:hypothetical protein
MKFSIMLAAGFGGTVVNTNDFMICCQYEGAVRQLYERPKYSMGHSKLNLEDENSKLI